MSLNCKHMRIIPKLERLLRLHLRLLDRVVVVSRSLHLRPLVVLAVHREPLLQHLLAPEVILEHQRPGLASGLKLQGLQVLRRVLPSSWPNRVRS